MGFRLVQELAAEGFHVAVTCRVLQVSTSGFYEWLKRSPSARDMADAYLLNTIIEVRAAVRQTWGVRGIHADSPSGGVNSWAGGGLLG